MRIGKDFTIEQFGFGIRGHGHMRGHDLRFWCTDCKKIHVIKSFEVPKFFRKIPNKGECLKLYCEKCKAVTDQIRQ